MMVDMEDTIQGQADMTESMSGPLSNPSMLNAVENTFVDTGEDEIMKELLALVGDDNDDDGGEGEVSSMGLVAPTTITKLPDRKKKDDRSVDEKGAERVLDNTEDNCHVHTESTEKHETEQGNTYYGEDMVAA